jgi:hypothetical protein
VKLPKLRTNICLLFAAALSFAQSHDVEARVRSLYDSGRWAETAQLAGNVSHPSAAVLFYRGMSLARLKQLTQAAAIFEQGLTFYPEDKRFPLELAGVAYRDKRNDVAKGYLCRALRLDPTDHYGNDFLATLYLFDQNLEAALKYWNRINKPLMQQVVFTPSPALDLVLRARVFAISGGQVFTPERLHGTEANLDRLDVFSEVHFDLIPRQNEDRFDVTVRTVPIAQPMAGWLGRVLPYARELPYQAVAADFYNIHQRAANLRSLWRWDPNKRRIQISLSGPLNMNPRTEYNYFADLRDERWDLRQTFQATPVGDLRLRRAELGANFEIGLTPKLEWTVGGRVAYRQYSNVSSNAFFANGWSAEIDNRLDYAWHWPERRVRVDNFASFDAGHLFTTSPSRLITARAGVKAEWLPGSRGDTYRLTQRIQTGRTFGNAPLDELFMLGMERDNDYDLWLRVTVATRDGKKGNAPLGREFSISQTDFDRKLIELPLVRLEAGPFLDAGWVGDPSRLVGSYRVLYDAGLQLTVHTLSAIDVRFVYGRDLVSGRGAFYTAVSRKQRRIN